MARWALQQHAGGMDAGGMSTVHCTCVLPAHLGLHVQPRPLNLHALPKQLLQQSRVARTTDDISAVELAFSLNAQHACKS